MKISRIRTLDKKSNNRKFKLTETLRAINYTHIICLFLRQNDRELVHHQNIHSKKLFNLSLEICKGPHDSDKIIFNYSSHNLSKRLLRKSLCFAIPPDKLDVLAFIL